MKCLFGALCLVVVLVYSQADEPHACGKRLGPEELHQVDGDWVVIWIVHNKLLSHSEEMPDLVSIHTQIHARPDNHTLTVHEHASYGGGKCSEYTYNLTLDQDHGEQHHLSMMGIVETRDGEEKSYSDNGTALFFLRSENTIIMLYRSEKYGPFLLVYRQEGQHVDDLEKEHDDNKALAKCLNFHGENFEEWHYNGSDFCHKKSVLPTLDSHELYQVHGDWVLVHMIFDLIKSQDDPAINLTSSHIELRVQSDNHTVVLHERNSVEGKSISYTANLILPEVRERIHRLNMENATENIDGVEEPFNDIATIEFFPSSENTMEMYYKSKQYGPYLLFYRRDGHHQDVKDQERHQDKHRVTAKYLGLSGKHKGEWLYDGVADFIHKKSAPEKAES